MTLRQRFLKAVYPVLMLFSKISGKSNKKISKEDVTPPISFYSLTAQLNNGELLDFNAFRGKKVLLVNTASNCGFTGQYDDLEKISRKYKDNLVVLGFPANDFKEQEKGTDEEIAQFCKIHYGVSFPLMKKSVVTRSEEQNPVYQWLTHAEKNGWCNKQPSWNFSKYLVNEKGHLVNYFDPSVSPTSPEVTMALN
ncbi:MAG TPA: glutathione peroxidase [Chitinophagaceae bacterium]|nr:glutathione peroxidase [Chitinophagaceae bacterium]